MTRSIPVCSSANRNKYYTKKYDVLEYVLGVKYQRFLVELFVSRQTIPAGSTHSSISSSVSRLTGTRQPLIWFSFWSAIVKSISLISGTHTMKCAVPVYVSYLTMTVAFDEPRISEPSTYTELHDDVTYTTAGVDRHYGVPLGKHILLLRGRTQSGRETRENSTDVYGFYYFYSFEKTRNTAKRIFRPHVSLAAVEYPKKSITLLTARRFPVWRVVKHGYSGPITLRGVVTKIGNPKLRLVDQTRSMPRYTVYRARHSTRRGDTMEKINTLIISRIRVGTDKSRCWTLRDLRASLSAVLNALMRTPNIVPCGARVLRTRELFFFGYSKVCGFYLSALCVGTKINV